MSTILPTLELQFSSMNKLISYLVGLAITIAIMYIVGFIIACIITVFIVIIRSYLAYRNSKIQYTKWEMCDEYPPLVSTENGETVFQSVNYFRRYNNFEKKWEYERVIDTAKKPLSEATFTERHYLRHQ